MAVAACDQQSLDGGSWVLAEQFALERGPPLGAFSNKRSSQQDSLDTYHMRLFEARWAELCLHRVRELELHLESKRKLGSRNRPQLPDPDEKEKPDKTRKGSGKGINQGPPGARRSKLSSS